MIVQSPSATTASAGSRGAESAVASESSVKEPLLKRPFDILLSGLMLALSAPFWAVIAVAIKAEDGGPVFYRQERWGRGQSRFQVLKFRTMVPHADEPGLVRQAVANDDRITRVGRVLRATGLDELPQILNIFRGDMSFVGPRALSVQEHTEAGTPLRYEEVPGFSTRLLVRPGLTGIATIYLPKDAPARRKFRADSLYIRRLSFWLDLRLVALSFWISLRGNWETRDRKF
jgi:lipopolysaccharide/colanic/teichoic acid biosynthesis glycosyltransferase